jgi:hypothetical protein
MAPRARASRDAVTQGPDRAASTDGAALAVELSDSAKTSTSLEIFDRCIERANNLLKIHETAHGKKKAKPAKYLADAHRAAIVLAISALDAFVRSFVISRVRKILANRKADLPPALAAQIKAYLKDDVLLEAARKDDLLDRVEKAFAEDFERRSFQGTKQISESLKLVGFDNVFHEVAISAKENEDNLRDSLNKYTKRRHAIAHRGDYDLTTSPPCEQAIKKPDAQHCIKVVTTVARHIAKLGESK